MSLRLAEAGCPLQLHIYDSDMSGVHLFILQPVCQVQLDPTMPQPVGTVTDLPLLDQPELGCGGHQPAADWVAA